MGCKEDCSIAVIFQELLIIETWNKCHWIWHAVNPKYMPLKPFQCIFPSQKQQNVKFLPDFFILQEPLIIETQNLCHWIWHTSNPTYMPLKPFQCIFPCQNQQNVKFMPVYWTPPNTKWRKHQFEQGKSIPKGLKICTERFLVCQSQCTISVKINKMWNLCQITELLLTQNEKNINLNREKVFQKAWKSAQTGFSVFKSQYTISELCVTSTFSVMKVFLNFWQEGLGIGFWNMVYW